MFFVVSVKSTHYHKHGTPFFPTRVHLIRSPQNIADLCILDKCLLVVNFFGILSICFQVRLRHQDVLMFNFCFTHTRVARHQHESTKQFYSNLINHSTFFIDFPPEISQWISNVGWQFFFFFFWQRGLWNFLLYYSIFTVSSSRDFTFITRLNVLSLPRVLHRACLALATL